MVGTSLIRLMRSFKKPPRKEWVVPRCKKLLGPEFYEQRARAMDEESQYVIGQVLDTNETKFSKVRFRKYFLDPYFLAFFPHSKEIMASKNNFKVAYGDIVVLEGYPSYEEQPGRYVTHKVKEILFKVGQVFDPVTGKRVLTLKYEQPMFAQYIKDIATVDQPNLDHALFKEQFAMNLSDIEVTGEWKVDSDSDHTESEE